MDAQLPLSIWKTAQEFRNSCSAVVMPGCTRNIANQRSAANGKSLNRTHEVKALGFGHGKMPCRPGSGEKKHGTNKKR